MQVSLLATMATEPDFRSSPHKEDDEADNTHSQANLADGCGQDSERLLHSHTAQVTACQASIEHMHVLEIRGKQNGRSERALAASEIMLRHSGMASSKRCIARGCLQKGGMCVYGNVCDVSWKHMTLKIMWRLQRKCTCRGVS